MLVPLFQPLRSQPLRHRRADHDVAGDDHERPPQLAHLTGPGVQGQHDPVGGHAATGSANHRWRAALERHHRRPLEHGGAALARHAQQAAREQRGLDRGRRGLEHSSDVRSPNRCALPAEPTRRRRTAPRRAARSPPPCSPRTRAGTRWSPSTTSRRGDSRRRCRAPRRTTRSAPARHRTPGPGAAPRRCRRPPPGPGSDARTTWQSRRCARSRRRRRCRPRRSPPRFPAPAPGSAALSTDR